MKEKQQEPTNNNCWFNEFSLGALAVLYLLDAIIYIITHFTLILNNINGQPNVQYYLLKQALLWGTVLMTAYAVPRALYINVKSNFKDTDKKDSLLYVFCIALSLIIIFSSVIVLHFRETLIVTITPVVTVYSVCLGWWIQYMTSSRGSRRSHTLNTILTTRTNEVYQKNLKSYESLVPLGFYLDQELCRCYIQDNKKENSLLNTKAGKEKDLYEKIKSCLYILNYFEFISQGIESGDLDEELIKKCFGSYFKNIDERLCYLIIETRKLQKTAFSAFVKKVKEWHGISKAESHINTKNDPTLGIKSPSDSVMKNLKNQAEQTNSNHKKTRRSKTKKQQLKQQTI